MIGLLRKELYGLNTLYKKSLLMVAVIYGVLIFTTKNDFFLYFGIFVMMFYSISNLSLDDSSGWGRYARTLPVSDRAVVGAKFVASFLYLLGGALFGLAVGTLRRVVNREGGYGEMLLSVILAALCCLLVVFILYPLSLRHI